MKTTDAVTIISESSAPFEDRSEAGRLLGEVLQRSVPGGAVILGIPRGGVLVAREAAAVTGMRMDIVLSRKIGAPGNPEFALGAIGEDGQPVTDEEAVRSLGVDPGYIAREAERQKKEIRRRAALYRRVLPKVLLEGETAVIVDDGLATGATMLSAVWSVRAQGANEVIVAVPVASDDALRRLAGHASRIICLRLPAFFGAVGQFYERFEQVEDDEVLDILKDAYGKR